MATILFKTRITSRYYAAVSWSKDWYTVKPWTHKGENVSYIAVRENISETGNVLFTYVYVGPFAFLIGKWIR
jgi:hypothetical protein